MNRLCLIAFSNIKRKKGAMLTIAILIAFSSFLSYSSISSLTNMEKNAKQAYQYANVADVQLIMPEVLDEQISTALQEKDEIAQLEKNECLMFSMGKYKQTMQDEATDAGLILYDVNTDYKINRNTCEFDLASFPENGIILGEYLHATGAFQAGDTFYMVLHDKTYEFEVIGFSENALFGTPLNINYFLCYISETMYHEILEDTKDFMPSMYDYKIKVKEQVSTDALEKDILAELADLIPDFVNYSFCTLSWETMYYGMILMPLIAMSIILVFAIILMLVAISIIYYNMKNFMEENLPNIGILKATGYTSRELIFSLLLEISIVTMIGILVGLLGGFISAPIVGGLEASMMGVQWRIGLDFVSALLAFLLVFAMVLSITLLLGRRYKKIFVLDALRGGISTHNFKKSYLPLDKTRLSLNRNLGIKEILFEKRKNMCILIMIAFLSFASCAGIFIYQTFGATSENMMRLTGGEFSEIIVTTMDAKYQEFDPTTIEGVKDAIYHNNMDMTLLFMDQEISLDCDVWDDPEKLHNEMLCDGRLPVTDNEIVISNLIAKKLGAKIGDIVYAKNGDKKIDYMVVGIDQKINHLGRKGLVTFEGIHRYQSDVEPAGIYISCEEGYSFESLEDTMKEIYPNCILGDGEKIVDSIISGTQRIMFLICVLFLLVTLLIVFLILMMVGKSRILEKKKQLGIYKALGFTTGALIRQNLISTVPVVLLGGVLGMIIAYYLINPVIGLCFATFGISSCDFPINIGGFTIVVLGIVLESFLVTLLTSSKIRKIEPITMIRNL